jgi:uncharacterized protein YceK
MESSMRLKWFVVCFITAAGLLSGCGSVKSAEAEGDVWVLSYFRQRYPTRIEIDADGSVREVPLPDPMQVERLHLAVSTDGRHWEPLNGNKPVWDHFVRDPFIARGPDGLWRMLATGGGPKRDRAVVGPRCLYATSTNLVDWQVEDYLPLMKDVRNAAGDLTRNIWAPEWFYDERTGEAVLIWSSSFEDAGWKKSRLWFARTRDWKTFTPAKVLFDPPYSVIDGTLLKHEGVYYLFHKEEEFGARTGERRAIRLATSKTLEGPYEIFQGPLNDGQLVPVITEGPAVMPDPTGAGWLLLYDYCMADDYGVSWSGDLKEWKIEHDVSFPADARHGSAFGISTEEAERLVLSF